MHLSRRTTRVVAACVTFAAGVGVVVGAAVASGDPVAAKPPPPPKVTQGQVDSAHAAQDAVAAKVGQLGAQLAQEQTALDASRARQEMAEQKVALAVSQLADAKTAAAAAKAKVRAANQHVSAAHRQFVAYVQASYADGTVTGTTGSLLTAQDPSALLDRSTLEQYQEASQINAISQMQAATVARSNADAAARRAVLAIAAKTAAAKQAKAAADKEVAAEQVEQQQLQSAQASAQTQLNAAQLQLATLTHQRSVYVAYVAEQRRLAAIARAKAAAEAAARKAAEQAAAAARRAHRHHHGGGSNSYSPPVSSGPAPGGGGWTAAKGRLAAHRALSWRGTIYIWAGGNQYGPTDGGCTDPVSPCGTVGFDCSGLVLYAWDRGWAHYAATQYSEAGSYHPGPGNFKPGDLLFWSDTGTVGGISHVAIYIGHGDVVQAPESGEVVKTTPWQQVESGYFGATRPLT